MYFLDFLEGGCRDFFEGVFDIKVGVRVGVGGFELFGVGRGYHKEG